MAPTTDNTPTLDTTSTKTESFSVDCCCCGCWCLLCLCVVVALCCVVVGCVIWESVVDVALCVGFDVVVVVVWVGIM